jgi:hypothetical protein
MVMMAMGQRSHRLTRIWRTPLNCQYDISGIVRPSPNLNANGAGRKLPCRTLVLRSRLVAATTLTSTETFRLPFSDVTSEDVERSVSKSVLRTEPSANPA